MNDFCHHFHFGVRDPEILSEDFEGAVITSVSKTFAVEHVVRHSVLRGLAIRRKCKSCPRINKAPNQPGRCRTIHSGSRPGYPHPLLIVLASDDVGCCLGWFCETPGVRIREQLRYPLLQRTVEEIHFHNLLKPAP